MKFFVKWSINPLMRAKDIDERIKNQQTILDMIKADLAAGLLKDWGSFPGESCGYALSETGSEEELAVSLMKFTPYIHFEVRPVLSADQTIRSMKKVTSTHASWRLE